MTRAAMILAGLVLTGGWAGAQFSPPSGASVSPYQSRFSPSPYAPNFYNRQNQPLSPYLNLFRGADPVTNYYYGVRPGLPSGNPTSFARTMPPPLTSQLRTGFLPAAASSPQEGTAFPAAGEPVDSFAPSSHPVSFGGATTRIRANAAGGPRPGIVGNKPPSPYGKKSGAKK